MSTQPMSENIRFDPSLFEQQLLTAGSFSPLHWLLDSGLLAFSAYEQWRNGELDTLDESLSVIKEQLLAMLVQIEGYAKNLGLEAEPHSFYPWQGARMSQALPISKHAELAEHLGQRWQRSADRMQFDLFMDNSVVVAENQLCDALAAHQWQQAEEACHQLATQSPNHVALSQFEGLIAYGKHIEVNPAVDPTALNEELMGLEQEVMPLARELLRQQARDFLALAWRRLALGLTDQPYDSELPNRHASYAWSQLPDWQRVISSIIATPQWKKDFELVHRLACAYHYSQQSELALLLYCYLVELDEGRAEACFERETTLPRMRSLWQAFTELEVELPTAIFPAYVLIREPGLGLHGSAESAPRFKHSAMAATAELLEQHRLGNDEIQQRQALKAVSPTLLKVYLSMVQR